MVSTKDSKSLCLSSNLSGGTNKNYMKDKNIKTLMQVTLSVLEYIDKFISDNKLQNEQCTLNFYDKLNEISVRK